MLYEGPLAPGRSPTEAQIAIVLPLWPNLLQSFHAVSWEPGKNFCGEWMPSELQPESASAAMTTRVLSWSALLSGGWGRGLQNRREATWEGKKI